MECAIFFGQLGQHPLLSEAEQSSKSNAFALLHNDESWETKMKDIPLKLASDEDICCSVASGSSA